MSKHPPIEVCMAFEGETHLVGRLAFTDGRRQPNARFTYDDSWLLSPGAFSIDPDAPLTQGTHFPSNADFFRGIGDSAPDKWGRSIMQRRELRRAKHAGERARTLFEHDYLMGVADLPRMGGIRFRYEDSDIFEKPLDGEGVPTLIALQRLYEAAGRIERGEETDEDISLLFCQGSSLGGARPKASICLDTGELCIAKFPKEADDYSIERWESVALTLAEMAGLSVSQHRLVQVLGRNVLLSIRFDREGQRRIPFMSAMARLQASDGESGSYLELVDDIAQNSNQAKRDRVELFKRVAFNVLVSNVDDHLRNHGFLHVDGGWSLSPLYDVNPTPPVVKARVLTTAIDESYRHCDIDVVLDTAEFYGLSAKNAKAIVKEVAEATAQWKTVATKKGATESELRLMEDAFEHDDLDKALA